MAFYYYYYYRYIQGLTGIQGYTGIQVFFGNIFLFRNISLLFLEKGNKNYWAAQKGQQKGGLGIPGKDWENRWMAACIPVVTVNFRFGCLNGE